VYVCLFVLAILRVPGSISKMKKCVKISAKKIFSIVVTFWWHILYNGCVYTIDRQRKLSILSTQIGEPYKGLAGGAVSRLLYRIVWNWFNVFCEGRVRHWFPRSNLGCLESWGRGVQSVKAYNCAGFDDASLNCSSWIFKGFVKIRNLFEVTADLREAREWPQLNYGMFRRNI
jgi:hypothetical protein